MYHRTVCMGLIFFLSGRLVPLLLLSLFLLCCAPQPGLTDPQVHGDTLRTPSPNAASAIEDILSELLNKARKKHGRPALTSDPQLKKIALQRSSYMARKGLLSHENSHGEGPTERAEKAGIRAVKRSGNSLRIGIVENVGFMPTGNVKGHGLIRLTHDVAAAMMDEWMRSPSHRDNILDPDVTHAWFATTRPDCKLMHCLPVRRGVAVTDRVLDGTRSVEIHEAQNRMWGQMAVLYQMMGPGV